MIQQKLQQLQQVIDGAVAGGLFKTAAMAIVAQNALNEIVQHIGQIEILHKEIDQLQHEYREIKEKLRVQQIIAD